MNERVTPSVWRCALVGAAAGLVTLAGDEAADLWKYGLTDKIGLWPVLAVFVLFGPLAAVFGAIGGLLIGAMLYRIKDLFAGERWHEDAAADTNRTATRLPVTHP